MREKLSAFVISHNRASLLESCLRAVSFVDELIVVDKSSTDGSPAVAARYADRVEVVPWSPTVEETRAFASSLCTHDRILFLDDDEILSPETGPYLSNGLAWQDADIHAIPYRHYILGVHDERAYYWPEVRHCLFRKGAIEFIPTVHGGTVLQSDRIAAIQPDSGVAIHHLSHPGVASWIERTNRYTDRPDRVQVTGGEDDLIRFAHDRIDHWIHRTADLSPHGYGAAVALLRAIYDMVDRLKTWETDRGLDGAAMFWTAQNKLAPEVAGQERRLKGSDRVEHRRWETRDGATGGLEQGRLPRASEHTETDRNQNSAYDPEYMEMQSALVHLRAIEAQLRERNEAVRKSSGLLARTRDELDTTIAELAGTRNDLAGVNAVLADSSTALAAARTELDQTRTRLIDVNVESEMLSGSASLFIRQYLPKLRRHLMWRLAYYRGRDSEHVRRS